MRIKKKLNDYQLWAFIFVVPMILFFIIFFLIPAVVGLYFSFTNYNGINKMDFIGLENYKEIFSDFEYLKDIGRTAVFCVIEVPLGYIISLGLAMLMTAKRLKGKTLFRVIVYWPTLLSTIMVGLTWRWIFGENFGVVNYVLSLMRASPIEWSSSAAAAFATAVIAVIWGTAGFNMMIFIGALEQIDDEIVEAAEIDGAKGWTKFRYITLPQIKPTSFLVILTTMIGAFKVFAEVQTLTGGGPGDSTTFVIQYIYETGFEKMKVGYSSACSMVLFVVLLILSIIQNKLNKED